MVRDEFLLGVEHWKVWTGRKIAEPIKLRIPEPTLQSASRPRKGVGKLRTRQLGYGGEAPLAKRETAQISK